MRCPGNECHRGCHDLNLMINECILMSLDVGSVLTCVSGLE